MDYSSIPSIGDGRPAIVEIYRNCDDLLAVGWKRVEVTAQATVEGEGLPIYAYFNSDRVDYVLIGGIHGREPAERSRTPATLGSCGDLARTGRFCCCRY